MDESQFLGMLISALTVLAGFATVIVKINQPINELRLVVQELKDYIACLKIDNKTQNNRLNAHSKEIDQLKIDVQELKTKIALFHD